MNQPKNPAMNRREFVQAASAGAVLAATPAVVLAAASSRGTDKAAVLAHVPAMHDANLKRLQSWIALPSIAAENRNYPQGAEFLAELARQAGFAKVRLVPTSGKPGVFGHLDAGAKTTVAVYFMYDVKQFVADEWSSPPLEGRLVKKGGLGTVCMGRGAVNQKGPENSFLGALMAFKAAGKPLPVNLVLVGEGEEEMPHRISVRSWPIQKCSRISRLAPACFCRRRGRNGTAVCRSNWARKGARSWSSSRVARNGGVVRQRTCTPVSKRRWIRRRGT